MSDPNFDADAPVMDDMGQPAQMAPQVAVQPANYQKQQLNVYTVMLIISLVAMIFGVIALARLLPKYGPFPYWETGRQQPTSAIYKVDDTIKPTMIIDSIA